MKKTLDSWMTVRYNKVVFCAVIQTSLIWKRMQGVDEGGGTDA